MINLFNLPDGQISDSDKTLFNTITFSYSFTNESSGPPIDSIADGHPTHIGTPTLSIAEEGFPDYSQVIGETIIETDGIVPSTSINGLTSVHSLKKSLSVLS